MTTSSPIRPKPDTPSVAAIPRLVVRTVPVDPDEPTGLLSLLADDESLAWTRREEGFVAHGEAARLDVDGPGRFAAAAEWFATLSRTAAVRDEVGRPGTGLVAFGSFAFAAEAGPGGRSSLIVPEIVVGHRAGRWWLTSITSDPALPTVPSLDELRAASRSVSPPDPDPGPRPVEVSFADGAMTGPGYVAAVAEAVRRIGAGNLDKVVLARDLIAVGSEPFDLRGPLARLAARYPACWTYLVDGLFGATPEMLVRLENGLVTSRVLAGTIRRSDDDAHDLHLAASLARSSKDLEEHEYAVRSVAEALDPYCSSMNQPESPFVLHLPNVMHLATDIAAVVTRATSALELAAALHPSAAVCGTPTPAALATITDLEGGVGMHRGRYAGPVGWVDAAGNGEWGIALRCAQADPVDRTRLTMFAGCGVVADSVPAAELAEAQAKFIPIRDALEAPK